MVSIDLVVKNQVGLHARPATLFVMEAKKYLSSVFLDFNGQRVNAKSPLEIMGLGIRSGSEITITADGNDETDAVEGLKNLIESNFGESA
jgi:phosphocarrier protein